jgi:hypothetical protein
MLTKTKIALVAALVAGSATVASAQGFDPNPANRYSSYATPAGKGMPYLGIAAQSAAPQGTDSQSAYPRRVASRNAPRGVVSQNVSAQRSLRSAPVALRQGNGAPRAIEQNAPVYYGSQQDSVQTDFNDRASSPYAGGVN